MSNIETARLVFINDLDSLTRLIDNNTWITKNIEFGPVYPVTSINEIKWAANDDNDKISKGHSCDIYIHLKDVGWITAIREGNTGSGWYLVNSMGHRTTMAFEIQCGKCYCRFPNIYKFINNSFWSKIPAGFYATCPDCNEMFRKFKK